LYINGVYRDYVCAMGGYELMKGYKNEYPSMLEFRSEIRNLI